VETNGQGLVHRAPGGVVLLRRWAGGSGSGSHSTRENAQKRLRYSRTQRRPTLKTSTVQRKVKSKISKPKEVDALLESFDEVFKQNNQVVASEWDDMEKLVTLATASEEKEIKKEKIRAKDEEMKRQKNPKYLDWDEELKSFDGSINFEEFQSFGRDYEGPNTEEFLKALEKGDKHADIFLQNLNEEIHKPKKKTSNNAPSWGANKALDTKEQEELPVFGEMSDEAFFKSNNMGLREFPLNSEEDEDINKDNDDDDDDDDDYDYDDNDEYNSQYSYQRKNRRGGVPSESRWDSFHMLTQKGKVEVNPYEINFIREESFRRAVETLKSRPTKAIKLADAKQAYNLRRHDYIISSRSVESISPPKKIRYEYHWGKAVRAWNEILKPLKIKNRREEAHVHPLGNAILTAAVAAAFEHIDGNVSYEHTKTDTVVRPDTTVLYTQDDELAHRANNTLTVVEYKAYRNLRVEPFRSTLQVTQGLFFSERHLDLLRHGARVYGIASDSLNWHLIGVTPKRPEEFTTRLKYLWRKFGKRIDHDEEVGKEPIEVMLSNDTTPTSIDSMLQAATSEKTGYEDIRPRQDFPLLFECWIGERVAFRDADFLIKYGKIRPVPDAFKALVKWIVACHYLRAREPAFESDSLLRTFPIYTNPNFIESRMDEDELQHFEYSNLLSDLGNSTLLRGSLGDEKSVIAKIIPEEDWEREDDAIRRWQETYSVREAPKILTSGHLDKNWSSVLNGSRILVTDVRGLVMGSNQFGKEPIDGECIANVLQSVGRALYDLDKAEAVHLGIRPSALVWSIGYSSPMQPADLSVYDRKVRILDWVNCAPLGTIPNGSLDDTISQFAGTGYLLGQKVGPQDHWESLGYCILSLADHPSGEAFREWCSAHSYKSKNLAMVGEADFGELSARLVMLEEFLNDVKAPQYNRIKRALQFAKAARLEFSKTSHTLNLERPPRPADVVKPKYVPSPRKQKNKRSKSTARKLKAKNRAASAARAHNKKYPYRIPVEIIK